jgi:signal transduction histidine kinase
MTGSLFLVAGWVLMAAAALLPLRRALIVAAVLGVALGYGARWMLGDSLVALSPLSASCVFLVVLLMRHLAEERRQARRLLQAERTVARARAREAVDLERTRIARDLHDGLAHHLSSLLLQVQVAQALLADGDAAGAATRMGSSVELARQCLIEAGDVVGVLRTGLTDLESLRGVADTWATVAGRELRVSLPASPLALDGARWGALMAALREGLTNISRHSSSRDVAVEVSVSTTALVLSVTDAHPHPTVIRAPGNGSGHGLIGLSERAALLHGVLRAGPYETGWQLVLSLPLPASTSDDPPNASEAPLNGPPGCPRRSP